MNASAVHGMSTNSYTSTTGAFALGRQSAQATPAASMLYMPVMSNGLQYNQTSSTLQPEIGGDYLPRGSFKGSVAGGGQTSFYVRGDTFGSHLYALCGNDTVTPVSGQSGAYQHVFTPFTPSAGTDLPWYTLYKNVSQLWNEQHLDSKLDTLTVDVNKAQVVTATANWFSLTPGEIAVPSTGSQVQDNSGRYLAASATINVLDEVSQTVISSTLNSAIDRVNLSYRNQLSQDEFVVGSNYATNSTLLQRTCQIQMDMIVRDKLVWEAIYLNGGSSSWSPVIKRAALTLTLTSDKNIPTTTQPYQTTFTFPGIDLLMMPVNPSGANLLRSSITAQLTLGPSGSDRFTITHISGQATY